MHPLTILHKAIYINSEVLRQIWGFFEFNILSYVGLYKLCIIEYTQTFKS